MQDAIFLVPKPERDSSLVRHGKRVAWSKEAPQQGSELIRVPGVILAYDKG